MSGRRAGLRALWRHQVTQNILALSWVQVAMYVVPLVTLPYLARQLGPAAFGLVVFGQSFAAALFLLIDYGFALSTTRDLSRSRDKPHEVAATIGGVLGAKMLLIAAFTGVAAICLVSVDVFQAHPEYLLLAWLDAVALGLSPIWYFQGMERMRALGAVQLLQRLVAAAGVFALVHDPADGWIVLALQAALDALGTAYLYARLLREVRPARPRLSSALFELRRGLALFVSNGAIALYSYANAFLLGLVAPAAQVAYFGGADRVSRAGTRFMGPVSQALYPRITHKVSENDHAGARRLVRRSLALQLGVGLLAGAALAALAPFIVDLLLGPEFDAAVTPLRVLAAMLPLIAVSNVLGIQWMLPLGMDRGFVWIVVAAGAINVALLTALGSRYGADGAAVAIVVAEAFVVVAMAVVLARRSLMPVGPVKPSPEPREGTLV